ILCLALAAFAEEFKTVNGKEYKEAAVTRVDPDGVVVKTKSGIAKVYVTELPKEVQERFHYDSEKAASYSAEQAANYTAYQSSRKKRNVNNRLPTQNPMRRWRPNKPPQIVHRLWRPATPRFANRKTTCFFRSPK